MGFLSPTKKRENNPVAKSKVRETLESLAFTIVFVWLFTNHIAQATEVPTESMKPSILVGDHFFLDKVAFPANYPESYKSTCPLERSIAATLSLSGHPRIVSCG